MAPFIMVSVSYISSTCIVHVKEGRICMQIVCVWCTIASSPGHSQHWKIGSGLGTRLVHYICIFMLSVTALTGESPYYLKNLSSGQYELLVIGKSKESLGSLRFKFTIERDNLCDPMIHLSSVPASNGSVAVTFREECFTVPGSEGTVQFQCSTAGREFAPCEFVYKQKHNTCTW